MNRVAIGIQLPHHTKKSICRCFINHQFPDADIAFIIHIKHPQILQRRPHDLSALLKGTAVHKGKDILRYIESRKKAVCVLLGFQGSARLQLQNIFHLFGLHRPVGFLFYCLNIQFSPRHFIMRGSLPQIYCRSFF